MSTSLAIAKSSKTARSERPNAAANDNGHLHLVADNTEGTRTNLSRIPALLRLTRFHLINGGDLTTYSYDIRGKVSHFDVSK